jgi:DNA modification methylase
VLDPFCGSGTTGVAALELGHQFIGTDLDPAAIAIAKRRLAQAAR